MYEELLEEFPKIVEDVVLSVGGKKYLKYWEEEDRSFQATSKLLKSGGVSVQIFPSLDLKVYKTRERKQELRMELVNSFTSPPLFTYLLINGKGNYSLSYLPSSFPNSPLPNSSLPNSPLPNSPLPNSPLPNSSLPPNTPHLGSNQADLSGKADLSALCSSLNRMEREKGGKCVWVIQSPLELPDATTDSSSLSLSSPEPYQNKEDAQTQSTEQSIQSIEQSVQSTEQLIQSVLSEEEFVGECVNFLKRYSFPSSTSSPSNACSSLKIPLRSSLKKQNKEGGKQKVPSNKKKFVIV